MSSVPRTIAAVLALTASAALLAGCSLLGGPARDDSGQVVESTEIKATELLVGDCFSYLGSELSRVAVTPCSEEHTHVVIGQGTLTAAEVDEAGGLQNAVSSACHGSFTDFTAMLAEGLRTEQEFLVSPRTVDGADVEAYSCVALDPLAAATAGSAKG